MIEIKTLHHVSIPVTDLERSKNFYSEILCLEEMTRPPFDFPGAWFKVGDREIHLVVHNKSTFRTGKGVDSRDIHLAIRVKNFNEAVDYLHSKGFHPQATDEFKRIKEKPVSIAGFPQLYIIDPDRNVIELNAEKMDPTG